MLWKDDALGELRKAQTCMAPPSHVDLVNLEKGGTGFAGHGDHLEARDFKHLGSGSGLGLVRPAMKTWCFI